MNWNWTVGHFRNGRAHSRLPFVWQSHVKTGRPCQLSNSIRELMIQSVTNEVTLNGVPVVPWVCWPVPGWDDISPVVDNSDSSRGRPPPSILFLMFFFFVPSLHCKQIFSRFSSQHSSSPGVRPSGLPGRTGGSLRGQRSEIFPYVFACKKWRHKYG